LEFLFLDRLQVMDVSCALLESSSFSNCEVVPAIDQGMSVPFWS
jgi:hypothetical protein